MFAFTRSIDFAPIGVLAGVVGIFTAVVALVVLGANRWRTRPRAIEVLKDEVREAYIDAIEYSRLNPFSAKEHWDG